MFESICISSKICLARNIKDLPFPTMLCDFDGANSILKALYEILGDDLEFRTLKNLSNNTCLMLLENHLITKELIDNKDIAGFAKSGDNSINLMINEQDHIIEQCLLPSLSLKKCFTTINDIDDRILDKLDVCFSKKYGFLTSCPNNVGTGMRASVLLFLPALTINNTITQIIPSLEQSGIKVNSICGTDTKYKCYFYEMSNSYCLGMSEADIIELVEKNVLKVVAMEENARKMLLSLSKDVIIDSCYRAYGILTNSYMLSFDECSALLSKIRLGIVLNLLKFKNKNIIDELYVMTQPAHLMDYYNLDMNLKEQELFRAKFVSEILTGKLIREV